MANEDNSLNNKYKLQVGNITVEMQYSRSNKKFNNCILNILKQKAK